MDKTKLSNQEKLVVCQKYYYAGFICLPVLWAIIYFWFAEEANRTQPFEEQQQIRAFRTRSGYGALLWLICIVTWMIIFHIYRKQWGEFADSISFIIPTGSD